MKLSDIDSKIRITFVVAVVFIFKLMIQHYFMLDIHATNVLELFIIFAFIQSIAIIYFKKLIIYFHKKYIFLVSLGMWSYFIFFTFL